MIDRHRHLFSYLELYSEHYRLPHCGRSQCDYVLDCALYDCRVPCPFTVQLLATQEIWQSMSLNCNIAYST